MFRGRTKVTLKSKMRREPLFTGFFFTFFRKYNINFKILHRLWSIVFIYVYKIYASGTSNVFRSGFLHTYGRSLHTTSMRMYICRIFLFLSGEYSKRNTQL
jgi:hypothetical protein